MTEIAFLLPWVGTFLLTPPVMIIWQTWSEAAGLPLFIIYIFVCWLVLIIAGAVVALRVDWPADGRARHGGGGDGEER
jgi:hypothetical protein